MIWPKLLLNPEWSGVKELSMIEPVEELRTEFNTLALGQLEGPPDGQVEVVAPWTAQNIPARFPEAEHCVVAVECRGIEIEVGIGCRCWQAILAVEVSKLCSDRGSKV